MSKKLRTGGEILIDGLINHDAHRLFCVPGESYLAALDALRDRNDKLQVITCRQEGGAAYMAEAHGKLTGKPGICFVSRGPGASNAMVGIHTAFQDSTPLLLFIGQVARANRGREAFQELDYKKVYSDVAKKVLRIDYAEKIPQQLSKAWHSAMSDRPGPVVIELPEDMLRDKVEVSDMDPIVVSLSELSNNSVQVFQCLFNHSVSPVIIAGGAGWNERATSYLTEFSENFSVPVTTAFRRSDSFDNTHPHYIGELGLAPNPDLIKTIQDSDLLIAVGPRIGDITTNGYTTLVPPDRKNCNPTQKLIHIHAGADELNTVFSTDVAIHCRPELFLKKICQIPLEKKQLTEKIQSAHQSYLNFVESPRYSDAKMRMDKVSEFLRHRLAGDSIITVGAGNFTTWGQRHYQFTRYGTLLGSTNGSMGYGVPSSIAAKLEHPQSIVVSFSGDGCFLMNGQELATAVQYNANVIFLVINNNCYGTIQSHQERHYPGRRSATYLNNPDFARLGEAYGAFSATVTKFEEFEHVFEQEIKSNKPALIEIQIDYYER